MKQSGLQYRFAESDKEVWMFWYRCMWCGKNRWDCLHHIISPSSMGHTHGDFNTSILNSSAMHNCGCHLDNGELHHRETEIKLLEKTLTMLKFKKYKLTDLDKQFQKVYWETHFKNFNNLLNDMIIIKNIDVPLTRAASLRRASQMARVKVKELDVLPKFREVVTIYIYSKNTSDLFILNKKELRKCTTDEWTWYFSNYLYPIAEGSRFKDKFKSKK